MLQAGKTGGPAMTHQNLFNGSHRLMLCLTLMLLPLADYVRRLPSLVHLHLRGLALMYRLGLKCSCLVEMGKASPLVAAAHRCICKTIAPMLIQDPALLRGAVRYLPQGMVSAGDSSPALIAVYRKCDSTLDIVQQQQLTQQQQQQQGGEGPGGPVVDQPGERSRQEVTDLGSAVLQHIMESSQHREQMLQQESGAARQVLLQTEDMLDQDGDMVDCAVAAGELLRLAFQALDVHPDLGRCSGTVVLQCTSTLVGWGSNGIASAAISQHLALSCRL
jgi:hypothetical protein